MAVAFEFRMKTSKKVKAFKGRHRRGTKCEPVCARAFFYDDKRPANVAAGSYGKYKLEVGRGSGACQCGGAVCYYGGRTEKVFVFVFAFDELKSETPTLWARAPYLT